MPEGTKHIKRDIHLDFSDLQISWSLEKNIYGRPCFMVMLRKETQFRNIRWMHILTFHWRTPWFANVASVVIDD